MPLEFLTRLEARLLTAINRSELVRENSTPILKHIEIFVSRISHRLPALVPWAKDGMKFSLDLFTWDV